MKTDELARLERRLGYTFSDRSRLELALTHRSCGSRNNERLEFLGDSIVNFVIAEALFERFPDAREGQLSRLRARMVRGATLAEIGREFQLGDCLRLGSGELKSGGYRRESILADAVEAIIGAIYLDAGMEACRERIRSWFTDRLAGLSTTDQQNKDPKTRLQEFLQARQNPLPKYRVLNIEGDAHDQVFTVVCELESLDLSSEGQGPSRRGAEQQAARFALEKLGVDSQ
ncbi:ribonuclease III [Endozoicomonas numazuensis]|uniref:Ribonuclease 3 n=1 Tax=Endozoicomonas numazuensis TaxID=1137799 RepID=A0A081NHP2_9GAMM|nr:ribonuclease III [Endozoicomonas numazuensis]KEQ17965.1 ribonuclease III [Endozoicomonas numazuensis]